MRRPHVGTLIGFIFTDPFSRYSKFWITRGRSVRMLKGVDIGTYIYIMLRIYRYALWQESIDALHGDDEAVSVHCGQRNGFRSRNSVLASNAPILIVHTTPAAAESH